MVSAGIKRIALEQIDEALVQLTDPNGDLDRAVHNARRCFKRLRAVLRLVRNEIGETIYKRENSLYRGVGRRLSAVRHSAVRLKTLDTLVEYCGDRLILDAVAGIRERLASEHQTAVHDMLDQRLVAEITATLWEARSHVDTWPLDHDGFSALCSGLGHTYRRGRNRLADARAILDDGSLHEWRNEVKYLWYQIRILRPSGSNALGDLARSLHELSDTLGDDHDLAELRGIAVESSQTGSDGDKSRVLVGLIDERRAGLQPAAWSLGRRVYVGERAAFVGRVAAHCRAWRQTFAHQ